MTKARTKAARRRRPKRQGITMTDGGTVPERTTQGSRAKEATADVMAEALQARCRALGIDDAPLEAQRACRVPLLGSDVGRCIFYMRADWRPIWDTWQAISAARQNYLTRIIGQTGNPQGAALVMVPDRMETDPGHTVDMRSADERNADAINANQHWTDAINALPLHQRWAVREALIGFSRADLWRDAAPTNVGRACVKGLVALTAWHRGT